VDLAKKLQIKEGMLVSVVGAPADGPDLSCLSAPPGPAEIDPAAAGAVIAFARVRADLTAVAMPVIDAARADRLAWVAYPKAGQLGTDINRDSLAAAVAELGIQPVRQVAIDDVWSALRLRPGQR
jgi:hypothetical protein